MSKKFRLLLIKLHFLARQWGIDPLLFLNSLRGLPIFLRNRFEFRRKFAGEMTWVPCLHDRFEESGATKSEYFWQDLLVARAIYASNPIKHVDIGSRVDGFVAHVATFREVEVFDVRPTSSLVPGVIFRQADLMDSASLPIFEDGGYCDSLSCLHAIEHFGLGRYGDPIDPLGYQRGILNMGKLLKENGTFYLATPIGRERVEFNANWVFDPRTILRCCELAGLRLNKLILITQGGAMETPVDVELLAKLAAERYLLGLFIFTRSTCQ